jgi:hypothetical protein
MFYGVTRAGSGSGRVRGIATRGSGMVRRESQFGNQMDAAPAGNRKHRTQTERGQHLAAGGARGPFCWR